MKIISWNVNGINAAVKKGFLNFVKKQSPDAICIQETKGKAAFDIGYSQFWNLAEKKGYSGTAIFSKTEPLSVKNGIGIKEHDAEGRVITVEFKKFFLVNVYVPNSGRGLPRLEYRKKWDKDFLSFLKILEKKKPVVVCGDLNVAHKPIDLANPKSNYNKTAGYTQAEIDGFENLSKSGFVDSFRHFDKSAGKYTYWGMWNNLRQRNIGWRIDYFLVSGSLMPKVRKSWIMPEVPGSDHCPVALDIEL